MNRGAGAFAGAAAATLAFVAGGALALLVAGLLALAADRAEAADYAWPVTCIVNGDTLKADAGADMPSELAMLSVRIRGIDTAERGGRAKCDSKRARGQAATAFTAALLEGGAVVIRDPEWGKWGGRVVADVLIDGRSLAAALLEAGHARPYDGGRRGSWCE